MRSSYNSLDVYFFTYRTVKQGAPIVSYSELMPWKPGSSVLSGIPCGYWIKIRYLMPRTPEISTDLRTVILSLYFGLYTWNSWKARLIHNSPRRYLIPVHRSMSILIPLSPKNRNLTCLQFNRQNNNKKGGQGTAKQYQDTDTRVLHTCPKANRISLGEHSIQDHVTRLRHNTLCALKRRSLEQQLYNKCWCRDPVRSRILTDKYTSCEMAK